MLVEVNCETDFVAKNENFREFVKDITLHIAAAHPLYVSRDEVPEKMVASERAIFEGQVKGKPENVIAKIVEGKLDKFYSTVCLLEQGFIKNPDQTIKELVATKISELGENIVIRRFTRYLVGEPLGNEVATSRLQTLKQRAGVSRRVACCRFAKTHAHVGACRAFRVVAHLAPRRSQAVSTITTGETRIMIDSLKELLEEELKDIYSAEKQLLKALPKMAKKASSAELRSALQEHLEVTKRRSSGSSRSSRRSANPPRRRPAKRCRA